MTLSEIKKKLKASAEAFKTEPEYTKAKGRDLYKAALEAVALCESLSAELQSYKAPKLFQKNDAYTAAVTPKRFYSKLERIRDYLANAPDSEEFHRFLKWNHLTVSEAVKLVEEADKSI